MIGWPSSKWLYGARLAPVSITRYGIGHRSRVIGCHQPGRPPGPPLPLTRGRLSGITSGFPSPRTVVLVNMFYPFPPSPSATFCSSSFIFLFLLFLFCLFFFSLFFFFLIF